MKLFNFFKTTLGIIIILLVVIAIIIYFNWDAIKSWWSTDNANTDQSSETIENTSGRYQSQDNSINSSYRTKVQQVGLYNSEGNPVPTKGFTIQQKKCSEACQELGAIGWSLVPYPKGSAYYGSYSCWCTMGSTV